MPLDSNQETLDLTFKTPGELSDYQLFYFARTLLTLEKSNALKRQLEINGEHGSWTLYNEKLIEKYIYGFFNIRFDCAVLPGYSAEDGGVWYNEEGYGGGCDKLVDEFSNDGKGNYTFVVRYGAWDTSDKELKPPYTVKKYTFRVEGQRFIILSVALVS